MAKFVKGVSGNPLGRTQGTRNRFSEAACADALEDWTANGKGALERVRLTDPSTYLRVLFSIIPKDVAVSIEQRNGPLDSEEMRWLRRIADLARSIAGEIGEATVLAWIEEDLRARVAKQIDGQQMRNLIAGE